MSAKPTPFAYLRKAADMLGGQAGLATTLGYKDRRNVSPWFKSGRQVPVEDCLVIERLTRAKDAPVTCEQLRPDVTWLRVPHPDWPTGKPLVDYAEA